MSVFYHLSFRISSLVLKLTNRSSLTTSHHHYNLIHSSKQTNRASQVVQMVNNLAAIQESGFDPWVRKRECLPTPVFLPREFHEQGSLGVNSPWGCKDLDTTEQLYFNCCMSKKNNYSLSASSLGTISSFHK